MLLANERIEIDARPAPSTSIVLETVMLGHCPGAPQWRRLVSDELLMHEITALGFAKECARLRELAGNTPPELSQADTALLSLYNFPIPIYSFGQFRSLFPQAFDSNTKYQTRLGGKRAWLPLAVQDFFENSGYSQRLKLWVIRVEEKEEDDKQPLQPFLPKPNANMTEPETLGAFERALLIPGAGLLALPDFERLSIPVDKAQSFPLEFNQSEPAFMPCSRGTNHETQSDFRLRDEPTETPEKKSDTPTPYQTAVASINLTLAQYRPDMQCLLTVPLCELPDSSLPKPEFGFLDFVAKMADIAKKDASITTSRSKFHTPLRHMQLIYPYLRGPDRTLSSAVGLVTGMQAAVSQRHGPWHSIGGRPLPGRSLPWPPVQHNEVIAMRNYPGITVLQHQAGRTLVDDERMCTPLLSAVQLSFLNNAKRNNDHWHSAETMRFMGWIRRQLQALGEKMIFNVDARDPRPEIALRNFFIRLYALGALRGKKAEESFILKQNQGDHQTLSFDIEIAPAFPIDRIRITFLQDRHSTKTVTSIEVDNG